MLTKFLELDRYYGKSPIRQRPALDWTLRAAGLLGLAAVASYGTTRLVRGIDLSADGRARLAGTEIAARPDAVAEDAAPAPAPDRPEHAPSSEATSLLREAMARPLEDGASSLGEAPPPPGTTPADVVAQIPETAAASRFASSTEDAAPKPAAAPEIAETPKVAETLKVTMADAKVSTPVRMSEPRAPRRHAPRTAAKPAAATTRPLRAADTPRSVEVTASIRPLRAGAAMRKRDDKPATARQAAAWQLPAALAPSP